MAINTLTSLAPIFSISLLRVINLCTGIYVQSCGHPSLTGLIYLCTRICVQSCGRPSLACYVFVRGYLFTYLFIYVQSCNFVKITSDYLTYDFLKCPDSFYETETPCLALNTFQFNFDVSYNAVNSCSLF